jgi:hypothetical protein
MQEQTTPQTEIEPWRHISVLQNFGISNKDIKKTLAIIQSNLWPMQTKKNSLKLGGFLK